MICLRKDYTKLPKNLGKESKEVVARAKELGFDVKATHQVSKKMSLKNRSRALNSDKSKSKTCSTKASCRKEAENLELKPAARQRRNQLRQNQ